MSLLTKIQRVLMKDNIRLRNRRGHYASSALTCLRDQYWGMVGEPRTNPADYVSKFRMMMGDAFEWAMREHIFKNMHLLGEHFVSAQTPTGGSDPNWDGYQDLLMAAKGEDDAWYYYVIELKAKFGLGSNFLLQDLQPQEGHCIQLGLYLKDMSEKLNHNTGILLYGCISDKYIGSLVGFQCEYADNKVHVTGVTILKAELGQEVRLFNKRIDLSFDLEEKALDRWRKLDIMVKDGVVPEPEYQYKYELTPELLREKKESGYYVISDSKLLKAIEGKVILGDWQVKYSDWRDKQLEIDGINREYSDAERALLKSEYRRRHPSTKKF